MPARVSRPASSGGDYFDFVSLAPDQFGLVLADISGKGISAALLMASLQANLRAQYANAPHDLAQVLGTVNKIFFDSTASNHYATLFFGVYHETERTLRYANCGHLPPVLLRASGQVERLGVTAPVVGLFDVAVGVCDRRDIAGASATRWSIFSDGVSEATSDDGRRVRGRPADRAAAAARGPARAGAARRHRRRRRRPQRRRAVRRPDAHRRPRALALCLMTTVNHRDTETRRTHGAELGSSRVAPAAWVHPSAAKSSLCVLRVLCLCG